MVQPFVPLNRLKWAAFGRSLCTALVGGMRREGMWWHHPASLSFPIEKESTWKNWGVCEMFIRKRGRAIIWCEIQAAKYHGPVSAAELLLPIIPAISSCNPIFSAERKLQKHWSWSLGISPLASSGRDTRKMLCCKTEASTLPHMHAEELVPAGYLWIGPGVGGGLLAGKAVYFAHRRLSSVFTWFFMCMEKLWSLSGKKQNRFLME